jgi:hypothetical protein
MATKEIPVSSDKKSSKDRREHVILEGLPYLFDTRTGLYFPQCTFVNEDGTICGVCIKTIKKRGGSYFFRCLKHLPPIGSSNDANKCTKSTKHAKHTKHTKHTCAAAGCQKQILRCFCYCYQHDSVRQESRRARRDENRYPSFLQGMETLENKCLD